MLRAGAGAYLVKGDGTEDIVDMIHRCVQGSDGRIRVAAVPAGPVVRPVGNRERRRRIEAFVRGDGVDIVYQPIFDLRSGRPVGAEALARFAVAALGGPEVWFAEAAEMGLGVELEMAAIRLAVRALDTLEPDLALNVNASPETCCTPELRALIQSSDAERIVLEITEHAPVDDYGRLLAALAPLRERGVRLAIDDTCSGYASLRHVLHLKPDMVKLDVTLTRGIERDSARRSLVEAIVGFAPSVGAEVLAEGIETAEQLQALTTIGCGAWTGLLPGSAGPAPAVGHLAQRETGSRRPTDRAGCRRVSGRRSDHRAAERSDDQVANIRLVSSTACPPPSATSVVPLTIDDSSEARNRQQLAISSAVPGASQRHVAARQVVRLLTADASGGAQLVHGLVAHRRDDPSGTERVRTDPLWAVVDGDRARQGVEPGLRGVVGGRCGSRRHRVGARHQHHRAAATLEHDGQRRARHHHGAGQVHVEHALPLLVVHVTDERFDAEPGARHDHIEASEGRDGGGDGLGRVRRVAGVPGDRHALDLVRHGRDRFRTPAGDDHLRALAGEQAGGRRSDARSTTGDERHLVLEPHPDLLHRLLVPRHG